MVFYSYEKIYLLSRGDAKCIVELFKKLLKGTNEKPYLIGNNWIIDPAIVTLTKCSDIQIAEFLGLLSFRHYAEYKLNGKTALSMRDLPSWIDLSKLTPSTLWYKEGNELIFPTENQIVI